MSLVKFVFNPDNFDEVKCAFCKRDLYAEFGCPDCKLYSPTKVCVMCNRSEVDIQRYFRYLTGCCTICQDNLNAEDKTECDFYY